MAGGCCLFTLKRDIMVHYCSVNNNRIVKEMKKPKIQTGAQFLNTVQQQVQVNKITHAAERTFNPQKQTPKKCCRAKM